jgi:hypothetical protein
MEGYEEVLVNLECSAGFIEELHIRVNGEVDADITNQKIWDTWLNETQNFYISQYGSESAAMPYLRKDVIDIMGEYMGNTECYDGEEIKKFIQDCAREALGFTK